MTIIEEMREAADEGKDIRDGTISKWITRWADALERSGALVPVAVGEVCRYFDVTTLHCEYNGAIYRSEHIVLESKNARCILDNADSARIPGDTIVQPVRLVPLAEWVQEENR